MYTSTKEISFCYGHRLINHSGKCQHLHGHTVKAAITLASANLDEHGMVYDFFEIKNQALEYIDRQLDHNMLLHKDDPLCELLRRAGERFLPIDDHPTAETLAKLIYQHMKKQGLPIRKVVLWETPSSYACYEEM